MTEREYRSIRAILRNLTTISKQIDSIAKNYEAENKNKNPQPTLPVIITTDLPLPVSVTEYYKSHKHNKWGGRLKTILEITAIGAAIWIGRINLKVLRQIERQTPEIAKSADAAKASAELTRQQLLLTLPAIITIDFGVAEEGLGVTVENHGHAIARNISVKITVTPETLPKRTVLGSADYSVVWPTLPPGPPFLNVTGRTFPIPRFNVYTREDATDTKWSVTVKGTTSWDDGFGNVESKSICLSYLGYHVLNAVGGRMGSDKFIPCDDFPVALRNALDAKLEEARRKVN